ncbi:MAG: GatB/YqeY domain-containing protein [Actinobacteria bacterium]|nr:GatB/YqeY domain-containing protein [Actinomycetota bacterium]
MSLQERIQADLTRAMKARDSARVGALRMALAALKNAAVAERLGPQGQLEDEAAQRVLAGEAKRRREAAEAYRAAGHDDRAAAEEAEAEVYAAYLPAQMSDDELAALVDGAIAESGADGPGAMGQVMKAVMPRVAGRADGTRVAAIVRQRLAR